MDSDDGASLESCMPSPTAPRGTNAGVSSSHPATLATLFTRVVAAFAPSALFDRADLVLIDAEDAARTVTYRVGDTAKPSVATDNRRHYSARLWPRSGVADAHRS